jgi:hypothetical protein
MQEGSQEGCKRFATVRGSVLPFGIQTQHTESLQLGLYFFLLAHSLIHTIVDNTLSLSSLPEISSSTSLSKKDALTGASPNKSPNNWCVCVCVCGRARP